MIFPRRPMQPMRSQNFGFGNPFIQQQPFRGPFGFPGRAPAPKQGLGGLLQRFFSKPSGMQGLANPGALSQMNPSSLQGMMNPTNLSSMMANVQKALGMAESVMPMVQQYGPLVKNIPAMLKIYSELKNGDSSETEAATENIKIDDTVEAKPKRTKKSAEPSNTTVTSPGQSIPKLYI